MYYFQANPFHPMKKSFPSSRVTVVPLSRVKLTFWSFAAFSSNSFWLASNKNFFS